MNSENNEDPAENPAETSDPLVVEKTNISDELEELKKKNLYLRADFDNYRKQSIKERTELIKFGAEPVLREFLSILDDLERAANADLTPETLATYKSGIQLIASQFTKTLEKFGIEEVQSLGQPFDPILHEALTSESLADKPANSVTQVFKKAYRLHGKVIRPAQVVVNSTEGEN